MRRRVLLPLLLFGLLAVFAILIPVSESIAGARTQQLQLQRAGSLDQIVQRAYSAVDHGDTATLQHYIDRFHDTYGEPVLVVDGANQVITQVGEISQDAETTPVAEAALRGVPQRSLETIYPWSPDTAYVAEPILTDGTSAAGAVVLGVDQSAAKASIARTWAIVGAVGLALLTALMSASVWFTRWVIRPVRALDDAANALAEQRNIELAASSGPPELRSLARSFEHMAHSVEHALDQQRGLVADASHQLRNPLAAIRLRIDALPREGTAEIESEEIEAIEGDLDRLERTVDRLLVLANAEHRANTAESGQHLEWREGTASDRIATAETLAARHEPSLTASGITLETYGGEEYVACRGSDLEEMVEILLDNARKYAGWGSTVRVGLVPDPEDDTVCLVVSDSGAGLSDDDLERVGTRFWRSAAHADRAGTGLGYAILTELARANAATVAVDRAPEGGIRTRVRMGVAR